MTRRNSSSEIKRRNKSAVLRQMIRMGETTKPELAVALRLSLPTVGQIVEELIKAGYVEETGRAASVGGRRPVSVRVAPGKWRALGIDITAHHMGFAIVDLAEGVVAHERFYALFSVGKESRAKLRSEAERFLAQNGVGKDDLLGVGISLPGIVSVGQRALLVSHALRVTEPMELIGDKCFPCPVRYFNDATAACMVECYADDAPDSFFFLSLSNTVGGAIVIHKQIVEGDNNRSGELGHICVVPGGRRCYCGQAGHYDAYGAAWLLAEKAGGDLAKFFELVEQGDGEAAAAFDEYLDMLAMLLCNTIMVSDLPVILGGYVGNYLKPYLPKLKQKVANLDIFGQDDPNIRICRRKEEAAATGGAMYFLEQRIESL